MLLNLKKLEEGDSKILDPSFLLDQNIIILQKSQELENIKTQKYSWFSTFEEINLESIIQSIITSKQQYFNTRQEIDSQLF